jgi:hypothetical protein
MPRFDIKTRSKIISFKVFDCPNILLYIGELREAGEKKNKGKVPTYRESRYAVHILPCELSHKHGEPPVYRLPPAQCCLAYRSLTVYLE